MQKKTDKKSIKKTKTQLIINSTKRTQNKDSLNNPKQSKELETSLNQTLKDFKSLVEIVKKLRGPDGCPWDKEQNQKSLAHYAIEEAHELAQAITLGQQDEIAEELGDFLFQVILQAQVAEDEGLFKLSDVLKKINEKMLRRHPHVFSEQGKFKTSAEVWKNWELIKQKEKDSKKILNDSWFLFPITLPALQQAYKIGVKTDKLRFDWSSHEEVLLKVEEELDELKEVLSKIKKQDEKSNLDHQLNAELEHELGDLLFSVAQLSRHLKQEPETCLRAANHRFQSRFNKVRELLNSPSANEFRAISLEKKEQAWNLAKKALKKISI